MVQDTGLGPEMFVSAYKSNSGTELKCYRYTDDPIDSDVSVDFVYFRVALYTVETDFLNFAVLGCNL